MSTVLFYNPINVRIKVQKKCSKGVSTSSKCVSHKRSRHESWPLSYIAQWSWPMITEQAREKSVNRGPIYHWDIHQPVRISPCLWRRYGCMCFPLRTSVCVYVIVSACERSPYIRVHLRIHIPVRKSYGHWPCSRLCVPCRSCWNLWAFKKQHPYVVEWWQEGAGSGGGGDIRTMSVVPNNPVVRKCFRRRTS